PRRNDAHSVDRSPVQEQAADPGETASRDSKPALRSEERAIIAELPAREVARRALADEHRAGGTLAMQVVLLRLAVRRIELDGTGDRRVAARRPVVASVELHRLEDVPAHPDVEPLAGDNLDRRADDREIEVGISEIAGAGAVRRIPALWIGHHLPKRAAERDDILVVVVADAGRMRHEHPQGYHSAGDV